MMRAENTRSSSIIGRESPSSGLRFHNLKVFRSELPEIFVLDSVHSEEIVLAYW